MLHACVILDCFSLIVNWLTTTRIGSWGSRLRPVWECSVQSFTSSYWHSGSCTRSMRQRSTQSAADLVRLCLWLLDSFWMRTFWQAGRLMGASMKPARAFGPALVGWVAVEGPLGVLGRPVPRCWTCWTECIEFLMIPTMEAPVGHQPLPPEDY